MIYGIASTLGIGSSQAEISDDEASDVSDTATPALVAIKQEKKAKQVKEKPKVNSKPKVEEEKEENLMVESEDDEEEEDDDEVDPDECVACKPTRQRLPKSFSADMSLSVLEAISLTRMPVLSISI
jgi:hypothetical protein